jgi:hypothetical protein
MQARQSRLRAGIGIPSDGLLGGTMLKGFVEADFAGGNVTTDTVVPRLRHYFVSATWKSLSNLSVLAGQTWGVAGGAYFPEGLAHAVMPRFGGAGFAFRRAPQIRVSGDLPLPGPVGFNVAVAALQPGDTSLAGSSANSATQGNDSAFPNLEGRVSANYKMNGKPLVELGAWTHYGREKYEWDVGAVTSVAQDYTVASQAYGLDARVTLPYVTLIGHAFIGENLDVLASIAGLKAAAPHATNNATTGTILDATDPLNVKRKAMKTRGGWAQAVVTPVKGFSLLAGMGMENPDDDTLALKGATIADNTITKNTQYSAGTIVNLTSKWRVSFEATRYLTQISKASGEKGRDVLPATQFEVGSLVAF